MPSTPRQLALYRALGAPEPIFAHLPMVLGPDKRKLSKRHGAISVEEFVDAGVIADALVNYLALVGLELRRPHELHDARRAGRAVHARAGHPQPGRVRPGEARVAERRAPARAARRPVRRGAAGRPGGVLAARRPAASGSPRRRRSYRRRCGCWAQFPRLAGFLFGPPERDPASWERVAERRARAGVAAGRARRARGRRPTGAPTAIEAALHAACEREGVKPRVLFMPVRVALTGSTVSPGLYESLELVGRDESLRPARRRAGRARRLSAICRSPAAGRTKEGFAVCTDPCTSPSRSRASRSRASSCG